MLKLTKTGIGLLTRQYRSVLKKCWLINAGVFAITTGLITTLPNTARSQVGSVSLGQISGTSNYSVTIGYNAHTPEVYSVAIGPTAQGSGSNIVAIGDNAHANADNGTSLGMHTGVYARDSVAIGSYSIASEDGVVSVGHKSTDINVFGDVYGYTLHRRIVNVAAGSDAHDAMTIGQLGFTVGTATDHENRVYSTVADYVSNNYYTKGQIDSDYLHKYLKVNSTGTAASAAGSNAVALGAVSTASGDYSSAFGYQNTASGDDSSAFGYQNTASNDDASAFGNHNTASGTSSSAFGFWNTASGTSSSAFGYMNTASGGKSSAFGYQSNAAKDKTTAIGYQAVANVAGTTTQGIISVGHKNGDPKGAAAGGGTYTSDYFSKITNVAAGSDAHDALIVEQLGFTIGSTGVYTGDNKVYTSVADYVSNNYYRKEDLGSRQVIDFARYFKSGKLVLKSENLGADLTSESENLPSNLTSKIGGFATKNLSRFGAFAKCEKACSRLSERYIAALGKNRAFEDIASADAGTFLFVSKTHKNVLDSLSQCRAANDNFIKDATTFLRVI